MIQRIIHFSVHNKMVVMLSMLGLAIWGGISLSRLPLDAIPDVTNNQVVVATQSPNLSAVEMEQFVTYPIEMAMRNIQGLEGIRSVSQFGLSIVTLDFKEGIDIYFARNQVNERLLAVREEIPQGFGSPSMNPITTGLGEIYQYVIKPVDPADTSWSPLELRTVQDWVVKKQLLGTEGVAEISSFGGYLKQYHIKADPTLLRATGCTLTELFAAVEAGSENTGAAYLEKDAHNYFIRGIGLAARQQDLEKIVVRVNGQTPVLVRDVATVEIGSAIRYGALTQGTEEAVGGIVLMLKGENSRNVILNIKKRLETLQLPQGLKLEAFLDREQLIDRTISTVSKNLLEGGLIVVFVLVLLLGHLRAGLVVASVIPLSMLFAIGCMVAFKVSGNLMSLGAIDFGLIVDGAVIIVENIITQLIIRQHQQSSLALADSEQPDYENTVATAATRMASSSFFGQLIILIVYVPLLMLTGIEGKMFKPMALTVIFALTGAVLLSLTYVPAMSAWMFKGKISHEETFADRLMGWLMRIYFPVLQWALEWKRAILGLAIMLLVLAGWLFSRMGGEFIPQLDEGDFVIEIRMLPGSSLPAMIRSAEHAAKDIQARFPDEVKSCTGKIGTSEVPMDPMSIEEMDMVLAMHPRDKWKRVKTRAEFEKELQSVLDQIPGIFTSIQQPIAMRFNELMSGAKTDVIVKVLGPDLDRLAGIGNQIVKEVNKIPGAEDVSVAKAEGLPQMFIEYRRDALARYGLAVGDVNKALQIAIAGRKAGMLFEGNQRFDIIVKLREQTDRPLDILDKIMITTPTGAQAPLRELADIGIKEGPMAVNRVDGERCVNVALNVRGRDIAGVVADVQQAVASRVSLPDGYRVTYGGQFENLQNAQQRLSIVVPAALLIILLMLYFSFGTVRESLLIFSAIPFAAVGGVLALWLRGMPFSISAGVGFIALFGVAVLNGMVLIGYFQQLEKEGMHRVYERIRAGVKSRFRPVLMTAAVASLGFLPMAIASGAGAEVQKPLATVVIGGLISSTLLTLILLPVLYALFSPKPPKASAVVAPVVAILAILLSGSSLQAQQVLSAEKIMDMAVANHPAMQQARYAVQEKTTLSQAKMPMPSLQAYTWLPFNPEVGVTQNFNPRGLVRADREVRQGQLALTQAELQLSEQALRREVALLYDEGQYLLERWFLLQRQDSLLSDFVRVASLEYQTGNINQLAKLNAETRAMEAKRDAQTAKIAWLMVRDQLSTLAGINSEWTPDKRFSPRLMMATAQSPLSAWGQQRMQLAAADVKRLDKTTLPGFGAGVVTNVDPKNRFLPNAYFSVNFPLFKKGYQAEKDAARVRQMAAEQEVKARQQSAGIRRQQMNQQRDMALVEMDFWEKTGKAQSDELMRAAHISRQAGESSTTEYLLALAQAFSLNINHLDAIRRFNEAVIWQEYGE